MNLKINVIFSENKNDGGRQDSKNKVTEKIAEHHFQKIKELISILVYDIFWKKDNLKNMHCINENDNYSDELNIDFENNEILKNNINKDLSNILNNDNKYENYPEFYFKSDGYDTTILIMISYKEYILKKGSKISKNIWPSMPNNMKEYREKHKYCILNDRLTQDIKFSSPSAAANFVCGRSASGNVEWQTWDYKSPKDIKI